jgi:hypothetical protein
MPSKSKDVLHLFNGTGTSAKKGSGSSRSGRMRSIRRSDANNDIKAILLSSDSDFIPAVEFLDRRGNKIVHAVVPWQRGNQPDSPTKPPCLHRSWRWAARHRTRIHGNREVRALRDPKISSPRFPFVQQCAEHRLARVLRPGHGPEVLRQLARPDLDEPLFLHLCQAFPRDFGPGDGTSQVK